MKCDELEEYYYYEDRVVTPATHMYRVYHADEVDAAIAELKARIQLDDDEMAGFLQLEEECGGGDLRNYIAELKEFAENACLELDDNQTAIDELRKEIESLKASHYAESVDAGMRERRLRRALWLARAERNKTLAAIVHCQGAWYDTLDTKQSGNFWNKGGKLINASKKCLKKAEEYR